MRIFNIGLKGRDEKRKVGLGEHVVCRGGSFSQRSRSPRRRVSLMGGDPPVQGRIMMMDSYTQQEASARGGVATYGVALLVGAIFFASGCAPVATLKEMREEHAAEEIRQGPGVTATFDHPLTYDEVVAFALAHNLDLAVADREREIRQELLTSAKLGMLPSLTASGEFSGKDRNVATRSKSVLTGRESLEASTSSEKTTLKADTTLLWNLLDFGVAFFRSRQAKDQLEIAAQTRRRAAQNLVLQVSEAYWRTLTARASYLKAKSIFTADVEAEKAKLAKQMESGDLAEVEGLQKRRELIENQIRLQRFEREFKRSQANLARLMGLAPSVSFELAEVSFDPPQPMAIDLEKFSRLALVYRPELYEQDLQERISLDDARIALARIFPAPSLFLRADVDANQYLWKDHWASAGIRAAWDLLSIPERIQDRKVARSRVALAKERRALLAAGILTQLHIAVLDYEDSRNRLQLTSELMAAGEKLLAALEKQAKTGETSEATLVFERARYLDAYTRYLGEYRDLRISEARILHTIGLDAGMTPETASLSGPLQAMTVPISPLTATAEGEIAPVSAGSVPEPSTPAMTDAAGSSPPSSSQGEEQSAPTLVEKPPLVETGPNDSSEKVGKTTIDIPEEKLAENATTTSASELPTLAPIRDTPAVDAAMQTLSVPSLRPTEFQERPDTIGGEVETSGKDLPSEAVEKPADEFQEIPLPGGALEAKDLARRPAKHQPEDLAQDKIISIVGIEQASR